MLSILNRTSAQGGLRPYMPPLSTRDQGVVCDVPRQTLLLTIVIWQSVYRHFNQPKGKLKPASTVHKVCDIFCPLLNTIANNQQKKISFLPTLFETSRCKSS